MNVETLEHTTLAIADGPIQGATFSPNGKQVAYITNLRREGEPIAPEALWISSIDGGDAEPVLEFGLSSYLFGWSPDGRYLLYMGGPGKGRMAEWPAEVGPLWLIQPDGDNPRPLPGPFLGSYGYIPAWSPDSQWIVYTGWDVAGEYGCLLKGKTPNPNPKYPDCQFEGAGVYITNVSTGEVRRLATGIRPVWSPNSSVVAFLSRDSGATELWSIRIDGTDRRQLSSGGQEIDGATWLSEEEVR